MPVSVDQTVDKLLTNKFFPFLSKSDIKCLSDIRSRTWYSNQPITTKQQDLVCKIVSKYLLLLKQHQWPVEDLLTPFWKVESVKSSEIQNWNIRYNEETNDYLVKFPYLEECVQLFKKLRHQTSMLDSMAWDEKILAWRIGNGVQGRQLIQYLLTRSLPWSISKHDRAMLYANNDPAPFIQYLNGEWKCQNAQPTLLEQFDQIVQQEQGLVKTAHMLTGLKLEFDYTVKNALQSWLKPVQIDLLCNPNPVLHIDDLHDLVELIELVNTWPVVINQTRMLQHLLLPYSEPVDKHLYVASSLSDIANLFNTGHDFHKQEIMFATNMLATLFKKLPHTAGLLPWGLQHADSSDIYSFKDPILQMNDNSVKQQFNCYILITK